MSMRWGMLKYIFESGTPAIDTRSQKIILKQYKRKKQKVKQTKKHKM